jgi:hypothetical protein
MANCCYMPAGDQQNPGALPAGTAQEQPGLRGRNGIPACFVCQRAEQKFYMAITPATGLHYANTCTYTNDCVRHRNILLLLVCTAQLQLPCPYLRHWVGQQPNPLPIAQHIVCPLLLQGCWHGGDVLGDEKGVARNRLLQCLCG